jgi:hypothetical protein
LQPYWHAFVDVDYFGKGLICKVDLERALAGQLWGLTQVGIDAVFKAADLDCSGTLSFFEFAAACLHSKLSPLDGWLAGEAFASLDYDGDGLLSAREVIEVFGKVPDGLRTCRFFDAAEWCHSVLASNHASSKAPVPGRQTTHPTAPKRRVGVGLVASLFPTCVCTPIGDEELDDESAVVDIRMVNAHAEEDWISSKRPVPPPPPAASVPFESSISRLECRDEAQRKRDYLYPTLLSSSPPYVPTAGASAWPPRI